METEHFFNAKTNENREIENFEICKIQMFIGFCIEIFQKISANFPISKIFPWIFDLVLKFFYPTDFQNFGIWKKLMSPSSRHI